MSRWATKKEQLLGEVLSLTVQCSRGHVQVIEKKDGYFSTDGGCGGHSEGEYCYCSSTEVYLNFLCKTCFPKKSKEEFYEKVQVN